MKKFLKALLDWGSLIIATSGYVLKHANPVNTILVGISLIFVFVSGRYYPQSHELATVYYIVFEILYIGFLYAVLRPNGLRLWIIKRFKSEEKGYRVYESVLGFLFLNNGVSIGYISSSTRSDLFNGVPEIILLLIGGTLFAFGYLIKLWSAKVVTSDIYYWKDMFLGRKICEFVSSGPYKFISNPMYGVGQLQGYAVAILNGSVPGLMVSFINQCLVFLFYFTVEKQFIRSVYK